MEARRLFLLTLGITFLFFLAGAQAEDKYPSRPIELVVPMGPGGAADTSTRCYSEELARVLKVPVNVVNRPGATGLTGTNFVTQAKKDGYTLLACHAAPITTLPIIKPKSVHYNSQKDLIPLGHFAYGSSLFIVRNDSPFKTLKQLVEYARQNPNKLKNAMAGIGAASHFNQLLLTFRNGISITSVPFDAGPEAIAAVLGGHVDMSSSTLSSSQGQIKAGKLRGLAITSRKRSPLLPDVPTTAEAGYPYINFNGWFGAFAPAGVPQSVLDVLLPAFQKAFENPKVAERAMNAGFTADYMNSQEFRAFIAEEMKVTAILAKEANIIQ